jgi:hypothetical protein
MPGWDDLDRELDGWADAGRTATLWWRDDDAVAPTGQLDRLLAAIDGAGGRSVPVCLAVIPALARPELATAIAGRGSVAILQHGYAHLNHAPSGEKKIELGSHRPKADVLRELAAGRERMVELFGPAAMAVLVPPWNRIAPNIAAALPAIGLGAISTFGPRPRPGLGPEILEVNTHIDIMDWHDSRRFLGEAAALDQALRHLAARRRGSCDPEEPTGLLTHHLVHDDPAWRFVHDFLKRTLAHPAVRWLNGTEVFPVSR